MQSRLRKHLAILMYRTVLVVGPPLAALTVAVWQANPHLVSTGENIHRFCDVLQNCGLLGVSLFSFNYLASFGIVIVLSLHISREWSMKRTLCFWIVATTILIAFLSPRWTAGPYLMQRNYELARQVAAPVDHWTQFLIGYPPIALPIALCVAWIVSRLQYFRQDSRHWLALGRCPRCHYDLRGATENGCSECGWNRPAAIPDGKK